VDQNLPIVFFLLNAEGIVSDVWYFDQFLRYSQSNSKVVRNRAKFLTSWLSEIYGVQARRNLYINDHAHFMRHVAKFHGGTLFTPKVTGTNMSHFKPIFRAAMKIGFQLPYLSHTNRKACGNFHRISTEFPQTPALWFSLRLRRFINYLLTYLLYFYPINPDIFHTYIHISRLFAGCMFLLFLMTFSMCIVFFCCLL